MPPDHPPQLYVIFMGGGPDQAPCRLFGPFHEAIFQNQLRSDIFELWVREVVDPSAHRRLATRRDGLWQLHDTLSRGQRSHWHWVSIKQMTSQHARQLEETGWASPQHFPCTIDAAADPGDNHL
jgi:hypothetical protein